MNNLVVILAVSSAAIFEHLTRHRMLAAGVAGAALLCFAMGSASAHDATPTPEAPMGWKYPFSCCADYDCRDVPADWISEKADGYHIVITGEVLPYGEKRIKMSKDSRFHWCSHKTGLDAGKTICLFVPPSGS